MVASIGDEAAVPVDVSVDGVASEKPELTAEERAEAASKLAKLDTLLEKAGMYSSFLFSNMATAATVETTAEEREDEQDEQDEQDATAKGKRKRARSKKAPREGQKKLKQMQEDAKLDTRQQPKSDFQQPKLLTGGKLRSYQLDGIRWLCNLFENGLNGILADEMGLGKTIQVIGLVSHLKSLGVRGPYLVVAPLSTLPNWDSEFRKWAPSIPAMIYHGTKDARKKLRRTVLNKTKKNDMDFPVVITSYEMILQDRKSFDHLGFVWKYVIIDEGHRLKNMNCKLVRELKACRSENRLLLTGTPLQNNLTELWSLLNFILPDVFDDLELFESWFSFEPDEAVTTAAATITADDVITGNKRVEIISKLHEILRPFLLRRLKTDVIQEMPSKTEIFVYCPMTQLQREYYKMILDGTLESAMAEKYGKSHASGFRTTSLKNRAMQLRKCCNHPYLFDEPTDANGDVETNDMLIEASGKMVVLDKMLKSLNKDGHKVLIFSQMTKVLDILQDFLNYRGYSHCRLDGSTDMSSRREQMDAFNASLKTAATGKGAEDDVFVFLLSTRAGGLGINLIAADTVIFFDSDWNPQQDNQAQDRCHRIGQTKEIAVYRLITENSFENRMIKRAIDKRKLERVVIQRGDFKQKQNVSQESAKALTNDELAELLKDDVVLRDGIESGGIEDPELARILDRKLVVESFVAADKNIEDAEREAKKLLPRISKGYEVVEGATASEMESFA